MGALAAGLLLGSIGTAVAVGNKIVYANGATVYVAIDAGVLTMSS
jgi:hypothetical protein